MLVDLGVVHKVIVRGERKDYYTAEDDITKVAKLLALAKKRKELDPAMEISRRRRSRPPTTPATKPPCRSSKSSSGTWTS